MEKELAIGLVRHITSEHFPAELESFNIFAEDCFDRIADGEHPGDLYQNSGGHNEFSWEAAGEGLQSLGILAGTVSAFLALKKDWGASKDKQIDSLKAKWQLDLINSGVAPEVAAIIVEKYLEDLKKLFQ